MVTNADTIQKGMDVYDSTGDKIGSVGDVYSVQAQSQTSSMGPDTSTGSMFEVDEGGVLGIGATKLYIPFSSVQTVNPGDSITLNCTKSQAEMQYGNKPDFLS